MTRCICLTKDDAREVEWQQADVSLHLGGRVTFVGSIPHLTVVIVGRVYAVTDTVNPFCSLLAPYMFEYSKCVRGPLALVKSDDDGEECDIDVAAIEETLQSVAIIRIPDGDMHANM